ncbi:MAG: hypothetical protein R3F07_13445 [Opitutaceae bacterium]
MVRRLRPSPGKWVSSEVEERAERLFREIRTGLGLKRKALAFSCEDGTAVIRTPGFTVTLWIDQDPDDPKAYRIGIEVGSITDSDLVRRKAFTGIFRLMCQSVVFDFPQAIDLEATIDRIEESDRLAPFLDYSADCSWLKLRVDGSAIEMTLQSHQARFSMPRGGDLEALIEGTAAILQDLESAGAGRFLG